MYRKRRAPHHHTALVLTTTLLFADVPHLFIQPLRQPPTTSSSQKAISSDDRSETGLNWSKAQSETEVEAVSEGRDAKASGSKSAGASVRELLKNLRQALQRQYANRLERGKVEKLRDAMITRIDDIIAVMQKSLQAASKKPPSASSPEAEAKSLSDLDQNAAATSRGVEALRYLKARVKAVPLRRKTTADHTPLPALPFDLERALCVVHKLAERRHPSSRSVLDMSDLLQRLQALLLQVPSEPVIDASQRHELWQTYVADVGVPREAELRLARLAGLSIPT